MKLVDALECNLRQTATVILNNKVTYTGKLSDVGPDYIKLECKNKYTYILLNNVQNIGIFKEVKT